jgi:predicted acetyltransferase
VRIPRIQRGFGGDCTIRNCGIISSLDARHPTIYDTNISRFVLKDLITVQYSSSKCRWNIIVAFLCSYNTISIKTVWAHCIHMCENSFTMMSKKREC